MHNTNETPPMLRTLVLIVNANKSPRVTGVLDRHPSHIRHQFYADGTATSEILDILGLGVVEKMVTVCVLPSLSAKQLLNDLSDELTLHLPGKGVAFTIPVSGIAGGALSLINNDNTPKGLDTTKNEVTNMEISIGYHLIVAAVNQGYSEAIADTAKQAGATGGTVWSARKSGLEEPMKLLGAAMQGEQEIVSILAEKDKKLDIMNAINEKYGIASEAHGIIFSLPVENVVGLGKEPIK